MSTITIERDIKPLIDKANEVARKLTEQSILATAKAAKAKSK